MAPPCQKRPIGRKSDSDREPYGKSLIMKDGLRRRWGFVLKILGTEWDFMPVAPTPKPPAADRDFVAKAVDLDEIKKAVEDAAAVSGPPWISYFFALFYVALAAAGVTRTDLLLEVRSNCRSCRSSCRSRPSS